MKDAKPRIIAAVKAAVPGSSASLESDWDTPLNQLGVDSLDQMMILLKIEDAFPMVTIGEEDAPNLRTLNDILNKVQPSA
jgi:acyl carrier protein